MPKSTRGILDADAPPRAGSRWRLPAAVAGGLAAVAAVAAVALGDARRTTAGPVLVLHTAGVTVELPAGWRLATAPRIAGMEDALAAGGPRGDTVVIGEADKTAFNQALLPNGLRGQARATTAALRHGGHARRYDGLRLAGRRASVYSVPTTAGVTMLACFARAGACARIGSSLRGRLLPLGPDTRFSQAVGRILGRLESRERFLAARLEQADGRRAQLATTKQLWWAYAKAAKALRRLDSGPADDELRRRLAEGLRLAGCAYGRAADPEDASEYAREGDLALAEQTGVAAALTGLAQAGYTLPPVAAGASRFTQLPRLAA